MKSLGFMEPVSWTASSITLQFRTFLGLTDYLAIDVRNPEIHRDNGPSLKRMGWHQDGNTNPFPIWLRGTPFALLDKQPHYIALWASCDPTEIRPLLMFGGTVFVPRPCEVVVFNNFSHQHRTPPSATYNRWFARAWLTEEPC